MAESFPFDLVSPERQLLSDAATAVIVPGTEGYFTVMAGHAPFMTTVKPGVVQATLADGREERIFVMGGFADVSPAGFTLLAEHATPVADLDGADLDRRIREAEEDVSDAETPERRMKAEADLAALKDTRAAIAA